MPHMALRVAEMLLHRPTESNSQQLETRRRRPRPYSGQLLPCPDRDHLAGVVRVLEVPTRRAVRDRLNGEGELQSGILSYGLPGVERSRA